MTFRLIFFTLNLTLKIGGDMEALITDKKFREQVVGVSPVTWWKWRKNGELPAALIIGKRRYYRISEIEAWLQERLIKTDAIIYR